MNVSCLSLCNANTIVSPFDEVATPWQNSNKQSVPVNGLCVSWLCALSFRIQVKVEKEVSESSYCSAMPWATGLQFYDAIADPKVGEWHISTKYSKCNSFQVTNDLLNSENIKVAIAQVYNEL